ncbi:MAG: ferredoxin [Actinomycetota bacterium]|jgi:ferredoxin
MTERKYQVVLDRAACTGHGRCYTVAPALFTDDEQGYGVVRSATIAEDEVTEANRAVSACPERAITLTAVPDGADGADE